MERINVEKEYMLGIIKLQEFINSLAKESGTEEELDVVSVAGAEELQEYAEKTAEKLGKSDELNSILEQLDALLILSRL